MEEGNASQSVVEYILQLNNRLKRCQDIAITRMKECQLKRKTWYDRDVVERKFVEGDLVMVLVTSKQNKLEVNWIGPGKVLSRISDTNYVIDLPGRRDRSTIYHVNLLNPYHRRPELVSLVIEEVSDDIEGDAEIPYPEKQCTKFDYHEILRESQLQLKLSPSQIDELKQVITENKDVFSPDPGTTHLMRMDIELISDKPIKTKPYRMSPRQINILREEIKRLLELSVIEIGQSDYTSPLILVESPNKDPHPCVDYRRLNEITRAEFFPLPNMEEIVEKVSAAPYVTVMDLSKGYFQIPLTPRAQRYAAFVTPFGTYISKKMMFGLWGTTHYIPNYSTIASPLTDALKGKIKKEKITWDEKCGKAFDELKAKLVTQPILFAPDFATEFILQTDAMLFEGDARNRWRDGPVCPAVDKELWRLGPDGSGDLLSKKIKTSCGNQFEALGVDDLPGDDLGDISIDEEDARNETSTPIPRVRPPPPITIDNVSQPAQLLRKIQELTKQKLVGRIKGRSLRVYPETPSAYNQIRKLIEDE
ncbi:retrovirus-related Pol polyprotein from transposon 297 [Trichonephila clavipes]|nr:retrovirus-related Pol polyprotein from transposon 297 [Trichonephila clavipes]